MARQLKKGLKLAHVFAIASGAMISSGLFILPGLAHARAGPAVVLSYLMGGLLATAGALSIAELTTAMPKAGGDYFFIARSMGPGVGTVAGLLSWFALSLKSAFAIVGMATFTVLILDVNGLLAGVVLCLAFVALNLVGVKQAARAQIVLVVGLFALMILYVVAGLPKVQMRHFEPFVPHGAASVFSTTGFVFVSFGGLLKVASMAEEVRRPGRTIPLGLILSLLTVSVFYALMVFVTSGVLGAEELDHSLTPISDGAKAIMGPAGGVALGVAAILAFVSTANAGIMAASRYLLAVSRDRLLPGVLSKVNARFRTPHVAVAFTGGAVLGALLLDLGLLVEAASTVLVLTYILACLSVIVLRESRVQNYRPAFRSPLYPWVQIAGIAGMGFVLAEMGVASYLVSAILILGGFLTYWFYGRKRVQQESALLHLVQRITARDLVTGTLEDELKTILRQRDEIELDRFDRLVEACPVIDLPAHVELEEFLPLVAERLAERVGLGPQHLADKLKAREAESSTILSPTLAVPHVVIDGEGRFDLLLARAKKGIAFSPKAPNVQAVFVLIGTRDERNFHLRALAAIAQIVQGADFEKRWLAARTDQALRDIVLLGKRQRR